MSVPENISYCNIIIINKLKILQNSDISAKNRNCLMNKLKAV